MIPQDIEQLILRHFDDDLSTSEQQRLAAELASSSESRALFASYMRLEGIVYDLAHADSFIARPELHPTSSSSTSTSTRPDEDWIETQASSPGSPKRATLRIAPLLLSAAVIGVTAASLVFLFWPADSSTAPTRPEIGTFTRLVGVNEQLDFSIGDPLRPGTLEVQEGVVEIEFHNGAVLIVEGPSRLDILSGGKSFLHFGKVRSVVPPEAFGFTVESDCVTVVDLGTEFGFEVDQNGIAEVHVFDGEVEMYETAYASSKQLLEAGQAVQIEHSGLRRDIPADQDAFVDRMDLDQRADFFVAELQEELAVFASQHRDLIRQERDRKAELRKSEGLISLRRSADKSNSKLKSRSQNHKQLARFERVKQEADSELDRVIREKLSLETTGAKLVKRSDACDQELANLKRRIANVRDKWRQAEVSSRNASKLARQQRALSQKVQKAQQQRYQLRNELRIERSRLRRTDGDVRRVAKNQTKAKRQLDKLLRDDPELSKLKIATDANRKRFRTEQSLVFRQDETLASIRTQKLNVQRAMKKLRRRIQQARKISEGVSDSDAESNLESNLDSESSLESEDEIKPNVDSNEIDSQEPSGDVVTRPTRNRSSVNSWATNSAPTTANIPRDVSSVGDKI